MAKSIPSQAGREIVGLVPAAGLATRIAPLPCSKEVYPVGFHSVVGHKGGSPKVVGHYLLEKMKAAGAHKAYIVLRSGKWDIPAYFGDGHMLAMDLAYLMMRLPYGAPFTLDQAYSFVKEALVLQGFPDILFQPEDAFVRLLEKQSVTDADIVLGLFPAQNPHKMDMVALDEANRVQAIVIKPEQTSLQYTWIIAAWTPAFTEYLHQHLSEVQTGQRPPSERETYVGDVIQAALVDGMHVETVLFPEGTYIDIGTPDDLARAVRDGFKVEV